MMYNLDQEPNRDHHLTPSESVSHFVLFLACSRRKKCIIFDSFFCRLFFKSAGF